MSFTPSCFLLLIILVRFLPTIFSLALPKAEIEFMEAELLDGLRSGENMSKFIKYLGIPNESLCHPDTDENMEPMFNEELSFGDLLMDEEELSETGEEEKQEGGDDTTDVENDFEGGSSSSKGKQKKGEKKPKKWPNGIVPYYISKDFNSKQRKKIENAIEDMNSELTNVYFRPVEKFDRNYVIIFSGKGCYAKLGMKGGQQPVSLQADKCLIRGTIQHEMLHVLGFRHEQNRPDRDYYVEILYNNIPKNWQKDYKRYYPSQANYVGTYDYYSVLHYPPQAPRSRGRKFAFRILDDDVDIEWVGNRERISKMDLQKAEALYSDE